MPRRCQRAGGAVNRPNVRICRNPRSRSAGHQNDALRSTRAWSVVVVEAERVSGRVEHHPNVLLWLVVRLLGAHLDGVRHSLL